MSKEEFTNKVNEIYKENYKSAKKQVLQEVHNILADFYDEELERNEKNAKINISRTIRILKERIEEIKI